MLNPNNVCMNQQKTTTKDWQLDDVLSSRKRRKTVMSVFYTMLYVWYTIYLQWYMCVYIIIIIHRYILNTHSHITELSIIPYARAVNRLWIEEQTKCSFSVLLFRRRHRCRFLGWLLFCFFIELFSYILYVHIFCRFLLVSYNVDILFYFFSSLYIDIHIIHRHYMDVYAFHVGERRELKWDNQSSIELYKILWTILSIYDRKYGYMNKLFGAFWIVMRMKNRCMNLDFHRIVWAIITVILSKNNNKAKKASFVSILFRLPVNHSKCAYIQVAICLMAFFSAKIF